MKNILFSLIFSTFGFGLVQGVEIEKIEFVSEEEKSPSPTFNLPNYTELPKKKNSTVQDVKIVFVSPSGDNSDGLTWATAFNSIDTAIGNTNSGDEILIGYSTTGTTTYFESNLFIAHKTLKVTSARIGLDLDFASAIHDSSKCVIDANDVDRVLQFSGLLGDNSSQIRGLKITNGTAKTVADGGGGILITGNADPIIENCFITNNIGQSGDDGFGGAILIDSGSEVLIQNCNISNNFASDTHNGTGGAIHFNGASGILQNCIISNNVAGNSTTTSSASFSGGIHIEPIGGSDSLKVLNNTISNNICSSSSNGSGFGGGLRTESSNVLIEGNTFDGNKGSINGRGFGGGVFVDDNRSVLIKSNTIQNNFGSSSTTESGSSSGGGIFCDDGALPTILNNTISNNTTTSSSNAHGFGGGIFIDTGCTSTIDGNTINGNLVTAGNGGFGGGIFLRTSSSQSSTIQNNQIQNNIGSTSTTSTTHSSGAGIFADNDCLVSILNNTISNNTSANTSNASGFAGGIFVDGGSNVTIDGNTISNNTASTASRGFGGGINFNQNATATISNNQFTGNVSSSANSTSGSNLGGGIFVNDNTNVVLTSNTFTNNIASSATNGEGFGGAIDTDPNATVDIQDNVFTGNISSQNFDGNGGAIVFADGVSGTVKNNTFTGNIASQTNTGNGGAIAIDNSSVSITDNTFTGNIASNSNDDEEEGSGGAIFVDDATGATFQRNTFTNNNAGENGVLSEGGGFYNEAGTVTLFECIFENNSAENNGGAIANFNLLTLQNSTVNGNTSNLGGGIYGEGATTVENSTISNNSAVTNVEEGFGGGIITLGKLTVSNSTVSGNSATRSGGGIANFPFFDSTSVSNSTIANNLADSDDNGVGKGGGIANNPLGFGTMILELKNSLVADNFDSSGIAPDVFGQIKSLDFNLVEDTTGSTYTNLTANCIFLQNPLLSALAENGGKTKTHALQNGSPAINSGTDTDSPLTDQRGTNRQSTTDIGAFEFVATNTTTASTTQEVPPDTNQINFGDSGTILQFTTANGSAVNLTVTKNNTNPGTIGDLPEGVQNVSSQRFWDINVNSGTVTGTYSITLDLAGMTGIGDLSQLVLLKRPDGTSVWQAVGTNSYNTVNGGTGTQVTWTGISNGFSQFGIGNNGDEGLAVNLSSFQLEIFESSVRITWQTESEIENKIFLLERKTKEDNFIKIGELEGSGNSSTTKNYEFFDRLVRNGELYTYRLADIDFNGKVTFHEEQSILADFFQDELVDENLPKDFKFYPNYPNPFNPKTTIKFDLPKSKSGLHKVSLSIFNILGEEVNVLLNEKMNAGNYSVIWNGTDKNGKEVSSGIYFYKLSVGIRTEIGKMTFLK